MQLISIVILIILIVAGIASIYIYFKNQKDKYSNISQQAELHAKSVVQEAERQSATMLKEANLEVKDKFLQMKTEFEKQTRDQRTQLMQLEKRIHQKEESLEKRTNYVETKEKEVQKKENQINQQIHELNETRKKYDTLISEQKRELEKIAGMSAEEAKKILIKTIENEARQEAAILLKKIDEELKLEVEREARRILSIAIQKSAAEYVMESSVSILDLPSDDIKGRIIGREGRNIRALEMATGVDLIIDDTPEAIILSSFDPFRREIAKIALDRLITDGRIHPTKVEEVVAKVKEDLEQKMYEEGEAAAFELGINDIHPELLRLLGKLRYRNSYGQNVLLHSKEVAYLSANLALELKCNAPIAKRAGLLHDIGKAIDKESEGSHIKLGVDIARKNGESEAVLHAMEAHHEDIPSMSVEAVIVQAADTISAARPGARYEVLEHYLKRLENLENIARGFDGVTKAYALQAGREIRILVDSNKLTDDQAIWLCKDIAKKIQAEIQFPGQIKVTVIREMRSVEYAK
jgi:ribonucrease Y